MSTRAFTLQSLTILGDAILATPKTDVIMHLFVTPPGAWGLQSLAKVSGYHKNNSRPTPGRLAGQVQKGRGEKEKTRRRKADICI